MEAMFLEKYVIKSSTVAVDLNAGANSGARIDMKNAKRVVFLIDAGAGTTPTGHVVSFQQHTAASGGTTTNLTIDNGYYHKVDAATVFTKVEPTGTKAASFDIDAIVGDTKFMAAFEVLAEDLTDGNRWVSCNIADVGGAQLGSVIAVVEHCYLPAYANAI